LQMNLIIGLAEDQMGRCRRRLPPRHDRQSPASGSRSCRRLPVRGIPGTDWPPR
jgi:hypothetical protein